ncbi:MAG: hypothetical protein R3B89_21045 [Polyangiaceae bacterium]
MTASSAEAAFQQDIIREMLECGWLQGHANGYDRKSALYATDCLAFVKQSQPKTWQKYQQPMPADPAAFLSKLASQLGKVDPNASDKHLRLYGTLGVLRHGLRDKGCTSSCVSSSRTMA